MRRGNLFIGLLLILLGSLFFLQARGMITDIFGWFWPFALILLGLFVLLGRRLPPSSSAEEIFSIDLQGASRLDVDFDHGAGSAVFSGGAPAGVAVSGSKGAGLDITSHLAQDGSLGVGLNAGPTFVPFLGPEGGSWRFQLTQEVPVALKVDAGASSLDFDFTGVKLTYLGVDTGASSLKLILPDNAGHTLVDVESGAASLNITIPASVAARIRYEQGVSSVNIDEQRFPPLAGTPNFRQSSGYDSAENKVEINLEGGANSVQVH